MEQQFKYIYAGKEVSKEEFTNVAKEMFKWFESNTINAIDYSSVSDFLGENYKSKGEINKHLKGVLDGLDHEKSGKNLSPKEQKMWSMLNPVMAVNRVNKKPREKHINPFLQPFDNLKGGESVEAYKETEGKLFYELDWGFITQMAERMASNKKESKYDLWNWKKPMTPKGIEDLKQATLRHLLAVLDGVYEDDGREFGHIEAISAGMMMINYQLKNNLK